MIQINLIVEDEEHVKLEALRLAGGYADYPATISAALSLRARVAAAQDKGFLQVACRNVETGAEKLIQVR